MLTSIDIAQIPPQHWRDLLKARKRLFVCTRLKDQYYFWRYIPTWKGWRVLYISPDLDRLRKTAAAFYSSNHSSNIDCCNSLNHPLDGDPNLFFKIP